MTAIPTLRIRSWTSRAMNGMKSSCGTRIPSGFTHRTGHLRARECIGLLAIRSIMNRIIALRFRCLVGSSDIYEHQERPADCPFQIPKGMGSMAEEESRHFRGALGQNRQERLGDQIRILSGSARRRPLLRLDRWAESLLRWRVLAAAIYE